MSFRNNLQHLRAERNMTQEQLAMLLGVSRQSVTKWEAEKSVPDMSRLIKMCQLFDCTLDELVTGDLTGRATQPGVAVPAAVPAGPPTDVCGFDDMQRRMARRVPSGIAAILVGCALGFLLEGVSVVPGGDPDTLMIVLILAGVVAGLAFLVPAGMEYAAFQRAHPYVEDFYTEEDRAQARSAFSRALVAGVAAIFAGAVCIFVLGESPATEQWGLCLLLVFIAAGVWLITRYGMLLGRTNVAEYNKSVVEDLEIEDIMNAQIDEERRAALLETKRANGRVAAVCGVIMILATVVGLALLFAPVFSSSDPSGFDPVGTSAMWFWVAWPVGGMLCGVATLLMKAFGGDR